GGQIGREPCTVFVGHRDGEIRRRRTTPDDDGYVASRVGDRGQDVGGGVQTVLCTCDVVLATPRRHVAAKTLAAQFGQTRFHGSGEGTVCKITGAAGTRDPNLWRLAGEREENGHGGGARGGHIGARRGAGDPWRRGTCT